MNAVDFAETIRAAGYELASFSDKIATRQPSAEEREAWQISAAIPVIEHRRIVWDNDGNVLYLTVISLTGDRFQFEHNFPGNVDVLPDPLDKSS